jgi:carotenoid 1,2-hydratase
MTSISNMKTSFDVPVAPGGYAWWYVDALSEDGNHGLTIIAFIGSVFSPYYAWARKRGGGQADPANHCALNVALYGGLNKPAPTGWAMTERGRDALQRSASTLRIGPSALQWDGCALTVTIDERTTPWAQHLRGVVRLYPSAVFSQGYALDAEGFHLWCPIAPCARVEVELSQPRLRWGGTGYFDTNRGERPLEEDFSRWDWSRTALGNQRTAVLYDAIRRDGSPLSIALAFDPYGKAKAFQSPPAVNLPVTGWRMPRVTRSESTAATRVEQGLEDAPFYSRSVVRTQLLGQPAVGVHESLSLDRWMRPLVQCMLPFRMPRRG